MLINTSIIQKLSLLYENCLGKTKKMRRKTKKLLTFLGGVLFTAFYCEFLIYYVVIVQCSWLDIEQSNGSDDVLRAFIMADPHLLGPRKGHWLDKWRREWQMKRAFQAIIHIHRPDVVFVLGDLFDEGEWSNKKQFHDYVERFFNMFAVPEGIAMHVVPGNHDVGFHNYIRRDYIQRFSKMLNSSSVQFLTLKQNHFVLINSMAMEGDSCQLCTEARRRIDRVSETLKCSKSSYVNTTSCAQYKDKPMNYSRPILLQHFPLYRISDAKCTEPDAPPLPERNVPFRIKIDALSKEATQYLIGKLKPRVAIGGHTHHGCLVYHEIESEREFLEFSVPSFSWRNRPDPKYMLATFTPDAYLVHKCGLPSEIVLLASAVALMIFVSYYTLRMRALGKG